MINTWFFIAVVIGMLARAVSGHVISVTAGLALGVILIELIKVIIWHIK